MSIKNQLQNFNRKDLDSIKLNLNKLLNKKILSEADLKELFILKDLLGAEISEEAGWRYIRMTSDTSNNDYASKYQEYVIKVIPEVNLLSNKLDQKILNSQFLHPLELLEGYDILIRGIKTDFELFDPKNLNIYKEIDFYTHSYKVLIAKMTIIEDNKEITLQQACNYLEKNDRKLREKIFHAVHKRRLKDSAEIDNIFSNLITLRNKVALNSGYSNFSNYMFKKLKRVDYTIEDCFTFHESVKTEVVPILNKILGHRKEKLNLENLRPWDLNVDIDQKSPLKPFSSEQELLTKTKKVLNKIHPSFEKVLDELIEKKHLDLFSRKNKIPGGYQYPLDITGVPFVFMNATHTLDDVITFFHEIGHAIHSSLVKNLELNNFKHSTSEVSELASMTMELLSMEHWDIFFENKEDLVRAKKNQLYRILQTLPVVCLIDKFQHWIYLNSAHSKDDRREKWNEIFDEFSSNVISWEGIESNKDFTWQKFGHLFEVPFYSIEYAVSGLGAIAIWKKYREDPENTIQKYMDALRLGNTKSVSEIYQKAGIEFSFDKDYIKSLMEFIEKELDNLV